MKRRVALALAAVLLLTVTGCKIEFPEASSAGQSSRQDSDVSVGSEENPTSSEGTSSHSPQETPTPSPSSSSRNESSQKQEESSQKEPASSVKEPTISAPTPAASAKPASKPTPSPRPSARPTATPEKDPQLTCTLLISCQTVLDKMDQLKPGVAELIPASGVFYERKTVSFQEGETVYDVLKRETRSSGVLLDAQYTPAFGTAYIRGIGGLYEKDCGDTSGWIYHVNGADPGTGCSSYRLKEGDSVEWIYTCTLGADLP
jgi:hypothetical protein